MRLKLHAHDLRCYGHAITEGIIPGQSMIVCVRGANAPKNHCMLAGEFAVGSQSA